MIPFLSLKDITAKYSDEIHEAVNRVVDSGWYLQGRENEQFEQHYADYRLCQRSRCPNMDLSCLHRTWNNATR